MIFLMKTVFCNLTDFGPRTKVPLLCFQPDRQRLEADPVLMRIGAGC